MGMNIGHALQQPGFGDAVFFLKNGKVILNFGF
jgi:hypothetical protein